MSNMRSKEVAELAGVSVRTLRHYHQIGILPEPERGSNGYRHYDLAHVARLLRIRRLAALGLPLADLPALLDDHDHDGDGWLQGIDRELEATIARLQEQRDRITALRNARERPDLPPGLTALIEMLGPMPGRSRTDALVAVGLVGLQRCAVRHFCPTTYVRLRGTART